MHHSAICSRSILALLGLFVTGTGAPAVVPVTRPPVPQRVALADCVVAGSVTELETKLVEAAPLLKIPGVGKIPFQIAVLKVDSIIVGPNGQKELRVGYVPPHAGGKGVSPGFRRFAQVELSVGTDGVFFLRKHPEESFYVAQASYDVLDKKDKDFARELALAKRCAKLLNDPITGLKSKDAEERQLTAAALLFRYRTPVVVYTGAPRTEPIDAEQSRLILAAILAGDWSEEGARLQLAPLNLFLRLGLTEDDSWTQPKTAKEWPDAAQKWLREHAATYRIQKYVPEDNKK